MQPFEAVDPALRKLMPRQPRAKLSLGRDRSIQPNNDVRRTVAADLAVRPVKLPFGQGALKPSVSAKTMHYHYDKHYLGYVAKVNALVAGTEFAAMPLEEMIRQAAWKRKRALLTNAAQVWNHAFFWESLNPVRDQGSDLAFPEALAKAFGSVSKFREKFIEKGMAHVGSGWLWLAWHIERGLILQTTTNSIPIWLASGRIPLIVCDLWEHAYYLDWKNDRAGWLDAYITRLANWDFASKQYSAAVNGAERWQYPSLAIGC